MDGDRRGRRARLRRAARAPAIGAPAAQGGGDEPALGRSGVRRDRRDLPVGLARLHRLSPPRSPEHASTRRSSSRSRSGSRWTTRCSCSRASASGTTLHGSNEQAVAEGIASSARIITSAAAIMVVVFGVVRADRRAHDQGGRASAWRRRSRSTRRSRGSSWCPPRCGFWATGTGGFPAGSTAASLRWRTRPRRPATEAGCQLTGSMIEITNQSTHRGRRVGRIAGATPERVRVEPTML